MDGKAQHQIGEKRSFPPLSRKNVYLLLLICYLIPLFVVVGFALSFSKEGEGELLFLLALCSVTFGLTGGLFLLRAFERKMRLSVDSLVKAKLKSLHAGAEEQRQIKALQEEVEHLHHYIEESRRGYEHQIDLLHSSSAKAKAKVDELNFEMDRKLGEVRMAYLEYEDMRKEYDRLQEEFSRFRQEVQQEHQHKDSLLSEYQHTISEQRMIIEKKQRYIAKLEGKVRDLMYEIRSLLQLEEPSLPSSAPPLVEIAEKKPSEEELKDALYLKSSKTTSYDLSVQLRRYIEIAQNFTGVDHFGYVDGKSPRFLDMSMDTYAIDLRRLFDSFRDETGCGLFIYSQIEEKLLFVNPYVKTLVGWSPEKFIKDFPQLMVVGHTEWQKALAQLNASRESRVDIAIRSRENETISFHCFMGVVTHGPFINHIIGLLAQ